MNDDHGFIAHVLEFEEETKLVHWFVTAQCFLAQLDAIVVQLVTHERWPFLWHALESCSDCRGGLEHAGRRRALQLVSIKGRA